MKVDFHQETADTYTIYHRGRIFIAVWRFGCWNIYLRNALLGTTALWDELVSIIDEFMDKQPRSQPRE